MKQNNIYICHTLYHVYITLIKNIKNPKTSDIVICNSIPNCKNLIAKLKKSKIFNAVYFYNEKDALKKFNELGWDYLRGDGDEV